MRHIEVDGVSVRIANLSISISLGSNKGMGCKTDDIIRAVKAARVIEGLSTSTIIAEAADHEQIRSALNGSWFDLYTQKEYEEECRGRMCNLPPGGVSCSEYMPQR